MAPQHLHIQPQDFQGDRIISFYLFGYHHNAWKWCYYGLMAKDTKIYIWQYRAAIRILIKLVFMTHYDLWAAKSENISNK